MTDSELSAETEIDTETEIDNFRSLDTIMGCELFSVSSSACWWSEASERHPAMFDLKQQKKNSLLKPSSWH